ncbi:hypothetical protein CGZ93_05845 [Enemella dayhoffiae]|uniref:Uncharacterized protein n=1 Tax=Enemella dayhoffiae TaxID=2016507 RepID=A0A255HA82_9ACTN|nr:M23 family metallopeptidase [Enemella dayhoffiae]OYO23464.1 hypothetical protein CGZ93_05845 [Enemella dayhoffiae]
MPAQSQTVAARGRQAGAAARRVLAGSGLGLGAGAGAGTPQRPQRGWWPWLLVAVAVVLLGGLLSSLAALQVAPPPQPRLTSMLGNGTCATPIAHSGPPGGGNVPGPAAGNKGGPGVRNPELTAPETFEQLNEIQLRNAKTIVAAARGVGANDKAAVMALMAAMVETRLYNLASDAPGEEDSLNHPNDGVSVDHRSVGMYQQQHWHGTPAERMDVNRATVLFLKGRERPGQIAEPPGLFDKPNWETRPAGEVIQEVQRSAFPGRYAQFEEFGQKLLAKVSAEGGAGIAPMGPMPVGCGPGAYSGFGPPPPWLTAMLPGVQPDTMLVAGAVASKFPLIKVYGGVREDSLPDHPSGRALDIMISSAFPDVRSPQAVEYGNQIAAMLQQNAAALGIDYMIWNEKIWSVGRAGEGWRQCGSGGGCYSGPDNTAAHRDHVHVTTFGNAGKGMPQPMPTGSGRAVAPLPPGFRPSGSFGRSGSMWSSTHTGEDFAAPLGTPVYAVMDGVVGAPIPQGWNGNHVVVGHAGGIHTHYAHLLSAQVQPGQQVRAGDVIGLVGSTGNSSGPHLHLEYYPPGVRPGDVYKAQDPVLFLRANGVGFD